MKKNLIKYLETALKNLGFPTDQIPVQIPKISKHGDFTTNYGLLQSKKIKQNPIDTSEKIKSELLSNDTEGFFEDISIVAPGFINFKINKKIIVLQLIEITELNESFGKNDSYKGKRALVEFVSANPTGPLTVGHGRNAILGDTVSRILEWNGYNVEREYYFNNAGRQMRVLGESVYARYMEMLGHSYAIPEGGYEGEYIKNIASNIYDEHGNSLENKKDDPIFKERAENLIFKDIEKTLLKIGMEFDAFFNENTLYDNGDIDKVIELLDEKGLIYKKDGATWFKGTDLGREVDRVMIKSTGEPTYRLPDIAYHRNKFDRKYDLMIDVFGADHMDAYPDVIAATSALGYEENKIKVLIHQFVTIIKDSAPIKMSTRKANFIGLDELIDDVSADVTRFFFIMRGMNTHLNFDLDLAKEQSEVNPVFYIQYAHARACNILRRFDGDINKMDNTKLSLLIEEQEVQMITKLMHFPELVSNVSETLEPQMVANYLNELAAMFHSYYAKHKVIDINNKDLTSARIYLSNCAKIVIKNGLNLLGIAAPEKM